MNSRSRVAPITPVSVPAPPTVSDETLSACAGFGVIPTPTHHPPPHQRALPPMTLDQLTTSRITLIAGPSGAGKTSLLRGLTSPRTRSVPTDLTADQQQSCTFDFLPGPAEARARSLALAGLAEPRLWALPARCLSVGEQARLRLALTLHAARPGDTILADELASNLDRASAYALCRTLRRWIARADITLIAASAHEDLEAMLAPDLVIDARTGKSRPPRPPLDQPIVIEPGTMSDYHALAHLHYRAGRPATVAAIKRAVRIVPGSIDPAGRILAGVLVVSMPTLNASWRRRAWPGVFDTGDKSRDARCLNDHLRTISRVIVEPRSRGLGVATKLVRSYLADPLTPGTEATASMGAVCPFFARAGMTPYDHPPGPSDTRLLDALAHCNITPERLASTTIARGSLLERELITWARARKLLPRSKPSPAAIARLTPIAACRLCARPGAYAFTAKDHPNAHAPAATEHE